MVYGLAAYVTAKQKQTNNWTAKTVLGTGGCGMDSITLLAYRSLLNDFIDDFTSNTLQIGELNSGTTLGDTEAKVRAKF